MNHNIIDYIQKIVTLTEEEAEQFASNFREVKIKKRQFIVQPNFTARHRNYVLEGAFRAYEDALAEFTAAVVENKGRADEDVKEAFFAAGYDEANMIDVIIVVGDKVISNYLHNLTGFEIDFPLAEEI